MRDMIVHDRRLSGMPDWGSCIRAEVDERTPIRALVAALIHASAEAHGISRLKIMCHGWTDAIHNLGFGLGLCAEGVTPATVGLFRQLHPSGQPPRIRFIEIFACGAAARTAPDREPSRAISGGFRTLGADGQQLMRNLAMYSGAYVKASSNTQYYGTGMFGMIDWGAWEGTVTTWDPNGSPVEIENNPVEPS